jgi:hypothetical protein
MYRWLNQSHPQTLQAGVILGYISAVFSLLLIASPLMLLLAIGKGVGAFFTANNKRWGYVLLAVSSGLALLLYGLLILDAVQATNLTVTLRRVNATVFPAALFAAVVHAHSRQYQKIWFE